MKKLLLLHFITLICLFSNAQTDGHTEASISGFNNLIFGMSKSEAIDTITKSIENINSIEDTSKDLVKIKDVTFAGILFDNSNLYFTDDKLYCGIYSAYFVKAQDAANVYVDLSSRLESKYGKAKEGKLNVAWIDKYNHAILLTIENNGFKFEVRITYLDRNLSKQSLNEDNSEL